MLRNHLRKLASLVVCVGAIPAWAGTLADAPLYLQLAVPPNVLFALSVEYPTANSAAYIGSNNYADTTEYLGIFDPRKCYSYSTSDAYFSPVSYASGTNGSGHQCTGNWSGNFLNWVSMTGLDEFRWAMTGGNRYLDTSSLTVLERTYQSGQGGTSNFPNKTFSGSNATSLPSGTSLTFVNQGRGVQMQVTAGGSGTALCTSPQRVSGSFSCSLAMQGTGETGTCSAWGGSGTSASPYSCTTFGSFTGSYAPYGAPTGVTNGTSSTFTTTVNESVTCTSPSGNNSSNFSCTLTDSGSNVGSCTVWMGNGTSGSPFQCSTFGTFGGRTFTASTYASNATYTQTTNVNQDPVSVTASNCSYSSSGSRSITCAAGSRNFTCSNLQGGGTSTNPYRCRTTNWSFTGSPTATYVTHSDSTGLCRGSICPWSSGGSGSYWRPPSSVTYSIPDTTTYYYTPSYTGSDSGAEYYYSTYNLTFGATSNLYVRAKVCDNSVGLENNCVKYGASSYKPVGEVQRNGESMRFGVFSYYNENDIDNAVMRSKLKYVAPIKWTSSGAPTTNTNAEWSSSTGVFTTNPDPTEATNSYGGAVSNSGVINYVNKFGRNAATYKTYDNAGKLYYESLRYLRGLQPTLHFYNQSTPAGADGFPIITTWDDPVQYSCQKNFIIFMGDTHTHCDKRLPGGGSTSYGSSQCNVNSNNLYADTGSFTESASTSSPAVNVSTWTNNLGTLEGRANLATTFGFAGTASYYTAGLAYWAAYNGFRTFPSEADPLTNVTMKAKSFFIDVQEYGDWGICSQYWYAAKYGGADSYDGSGRPQNWCANPSGTGGTCVNPTCPGNYNYVGDLPKTLLPAGNPNAMVAAVHGALAAIAAQSGAGAGVGLSTGDLRTGNGTNLFSASYNSSNWSGDMMSYRMANDLSIASTPVWKASTYINPTSLNSGTTKPWSTRRILTFNDGLMTDGTASTDSNSRLPIDFQYDNVSERQQTFLDYDAASDSADGGGYDRVDYIRGDNSNESPNGNNWRTRKSTDPSSNTDFYFSMGDFINSSPLYVRFATSANVPAADFPSFKTYATAISSRTPLVYVGGNDGMLHVFDASDNSDDGVTAPGATSNSGKEVLAFIPSAVYYNLNKLTWPNYAHKYFVDGSPVSADVQKSDSTWMTLVTGGLNAGGQGIYAINGTYPSGSASPSPTNAANFASGSASSVVLWEFTDRDDADLGFTFAQPIVRKMKNGKWAVIVGNGYNNTFSDGAISSTGDAYLFILFVDGPSGPPNVTGGGKTWTSGTDYVKIRLPAPNGSGAPLVPANGLSSVYAVDKDYDAVVDYLYAGDRYGNLWKIDVTSTSPSSWGSAFMSSGTTPMPLPLFTAQTEDSTPLIQQVTTSPIAVPHPKGGFMVLFGTGSYVDSSDNTPPYSTNSFYGIWDKGDGTRVTSRSQLQHQKTLAAVGSGGVTYGIQSTCMPQYNATPTAASAATATCPATLAPPTSGGNVDQQLGWVMDLRNDPSASGNTGERYMSSTLPILEGGLLTFVTYTPSVSICGSGGDYDYVYNIDYLSGGAFGSPIYYSGTTTATALTISANIGGTGSVNYYPSGRKLSTSIGQNPKSVYYQADKGSKSPTSVSGCTNFVKGRPCVKDKYRCNIVTTAAGCENIIKSPATGRISWRKIVQ